METIGYYQSIESFALVDGPGVRSVLFLQGCRMRCLFCHNPDTWAMNVGKTITPEEAFTRLLKYKPYWQNNGGITVSGGEPLLQMDFLLAFGRLCHDAGISLAIDTAGNPFTREEPFFSQFEQLLPLVSVFLMDIKSLDKVIHKKLTGWDNDNILDMFHFLSDRNIPIWVRQVLVPGVNDQESVLKETGDFIAGLRNVQKVEVLPYHTLGIPKYEKLGIPYPLKGVLSPTEEEVKTAEALLRVKDYPKTDIEK
jgi:pyruvate formate lyase activating enzyme